MTNPITPPPELVVKWIKSARYKDFMPYPEGYEQYEQRLTTRAAQWGADCELNACCEWLIQGWDNVKADKLRAVRRPKPPSLKEQALLQLDTLNADLAMHGRGCDLSQIRRALEQLND
jgi:hypothetical protein